MIGPNEALIFEVELLDIGGPRMAGDSWTGDLIAPTARQDIAGTRARRRRAGSAAGDGGDDGDGIAIVQRRGIEFHHLRLRFGRKRGTEIADGTRDHTAHHQSHHRRTRA